MIPQSFPLYAATSVGGVVYLVVGWSMSPATGNVRPYLVPLEIPGHPYVESETKLRYWRPEDGEPEPLPQDHVAAETAVIPRIRNYWPDRRNF